MAINKNWHEKHPMPKNATSKEKIQWHVAHNRECGCRPIPQKIKDVMLQRKPFVIAGVLVKNKNRYLLVKEILEDENEWWIIPGGKVEFGETIEKAAKRELFEETGIKVKKIKFLCFKEAIYPEYNYHTVIFFFSAKTTQTKLRKDIDGKVKESRWFTKDEIKKVKLVESTKELVKENIF